MRVLHIGKFYPPVPGGIESFTAELARAQRDAGMTVQALVHAPPGTFRTRARVHEGIPVEETACWGQLFYAPVSPTFPVVMARVVREFQPDLLHIHVPNTSGFFVPLVPGVRRLPRVIHWHADIPLDGGSRALRLAYPLYQPWERQLLAGADAVIATSSAYADASAALTPWRKKVTIIPLCLAERAVTPPAAPLRAGRQENSGC
ncbi:glycosyltransferase [Paucibacter sp. O1-1]|nr:glycosyltransferase [Paucibacter sp. O1-1]MDA3831003.1 glycosyltransferase [Paucibacter sp. O1-1]